MGRSESRFLFAVIALAFCLALRPIASMWSYHNSEVFYVKSLDVREGEQLQTLISKEKIDGYSKVRVSIISKGIDR